jgi:Protein of unknown function (DUF1236)
MLTVEGAPRASSVNFALTVGTPVPNTVCVAPIPSIVVDIEPTWRGFRYFLVGDDIIVVNPSTHLIVAVITA